MTVKGLRTSYVIEDEFVKQIGVGTLDEHGVDMVDDFDHLDLDIIAWLREDMRCTYEHLRAEEQERKREKFRQFAGSKVRINDESGKQIGIGTLDEHGVVRGIIDGEEYERQLTDITVGEEE